MPHCNEAGLAIIESAEGLELRSYPDPGTGGDPWTVGYGHTAAVHPGQVITLAQALAFLRDDVAGAESAVAAAVQVTLTPNQFSALVSWQFNTGALAGSPLLTCINACDWTGAMDHLQRYVYAGGRVMAGLVTRRAAEAKLFATR